MIEWKKADFQAWLESRPEWKNEISYKYQQENYADWDYFDIVVAKYPIQTSHTDFYAWTIQQWQKESVLNWANRLEAELATERESTQQALQTSQTWHERQKAEIITQWKTKLQTFINQRKTQLRQEIQLIKEVLHE